MTGLVAHLKVSFDYLAKKAVTGMPPRRYGAAGSAPLNFNFGGTGGFAAGTVLVDQVRTLAGGANESLNLTAVLADVMGDLATFAKVKGIAVLLGTNADLSTPATSILLGNAGTNSAALFMGAVTHTHRVYLGGFYAAGVGNAAGVAIAAGTADRLKVLNEDGAHSATYRILLIGA